MNKITGFVLAILIGGMVYGCSSENRAPQNINLQPLSFTEDLNISLDDPNILIGDFSGLAVDRKGVIYVADTKLQKVHLISPEGQYLDSLGRKGKGPGEFMWMDSQIEIQSDTLYVMDRENWRITMFNLADNTLVGAVNIPKSKIDGADIGSARELFPLPNGHIMILFVDPYFKDPSETDIPRKTTVSLIDKSGKFVTKKFLQLPTLFPTSQKVIYMDERSVRIYKASFYPAIKAVTDNQGHLYIGSSDSLLLQKYDGHGRAVGTLQGAFLGPPLVEADIDSISDKKGESFSKIVQKIDAPSHWPAFQTILFDDAGRAWVQLVAPGEQEQSWIIFGKEHKPKWEIKLPTKVSLYEVQDGKAYGIFQSKDSISKVVRFNIEGF